MGETTTMLSYFLLLFILYVYLPYTIFKFATELSIDLGRRRDSTQLEEIVAGFLPCFFMHLWAYGLFWIAKTIGAIENHVDIGFLASMVGDNRAQIADYVFSAEWDGTVFYIGALWLSAFINGAWFGRAVRNACTRATALRGLDDLRSDRQWIGYRLINRLKHIGRSLKVIWRRVVMGDSLSNWTVKGELKSWVSCSEVDLHLLPAWLWWYRFFGEAIVPLFPWQAKPPYVVAVTRTETSTWMYQGRFLCYDKTTDGRIDGIRLADATQYEWDSANKRLIELHRDIEVLYLQWSQILDLRASVEKGDLPTILRPDDGYVPLRGSNWQPRPTRTTPPLVMLCLLLLLPLQSLTAQNRPCVSTGDECDARAHGCGKKGTPEGEFNEQSRNLDLRTTDPIRMKFEQFEKLQQEAGQRRWLPGFGVKDRWTFRYVLKITAGTVAKPDEIRMKRIGEDSLVEIRGYVVGQPHAHRGESANCRLLDADYSNFRINIAELSGDSEFDSIIAEVIPQKREGKDWTLLKLRRIAQGKILVRVQGKLFYNNKEIVNNDPEKPIADRPGRLTVWEIHPVTEIFVCMAKPKECDGDQKLWRPLSEIVVGEIE